jgi:hypothetical protein
MLLFMAVFAGFGQDKPYYYQIPDTPAVYTPATVAARLVDGLGFRYFWATEGLTEKDLAFRPGEKVRSTFETLEHINGLTLILLNAVEGRSTKPSPAQAKPGFESAASNPRTNPFGQ